MASVPVTVAAYRGSNGRWFSLWNGAEAAVTLVDEATDER